MEPASSAESLLELMSWAVWGVIVLCGFFYFTYSYLFEILAQKLDESRWMAWVPLASWLLMMRLVGWERWFWVLLGGYVVAMGSIFLPGPLMMVGMLVMIPLGALGVVLSLAYFPKLAVKRDLPMSVGLWVVLPQFAPPFVEWAVPGLGLWASLAATLAAAGAFGKIVFHDGRPKYGPHPIGYAITFLVTFGMGFAMFTLQDRLMEHEGFDEAWQTFVEQLETTPFGSLPDWTDAPEEVVEEVLPEASPFEEPEPVEIAETCPEGTVERSGPQDGGRAWWCELEVNGRAVRHGPSRSWWPNGYLASEGLYDQGRRTGTWTRYWRHGGRQVQAEFADDVQHGWMHRWDDLGNFENAVHYAAGEPSPVRAQ